MIIISDGFRDEPLSIAECSLIKCCLRAELRDIERQISERANDKSIIARFNIAALKRQKRQIDNLIKKMEVKR